MKKKKTSESIGNIDHMSGGQINISQGGFIQNNQYTEAGGDIVGRDKITQGINADELSRLFKVVYKVIDQTQDLSKQEKANLKDDVKEIYKEVKKGDKADGNFLARRLRNIKRMAPDIFEVVVTLITNRPAGISMIAKKIAEKMRTERT